MIRQTAKGEWGLLLLAADRVKGAAMRWTEELTRPLAGGGGRRGDGRGEEKRGLAARRKAPRKEEAHKAIHMPHTGPSLVSLTLGRTGQRPLGFKNGLLAMEEGKKEVSAFSSSSPRLISAKEGKKY